MLALWEIVTGPLGTALMGLLTVLGIWGGKKWGEHKGRSEGRNEAQQEMRNADYERADEIRRRARDADGNGVQPDDTRGFRDR